MPIVGTAGHVDHGKSTLVRALTGIDPDRLAEEKRRGMTIDLGFAHLDLPSGERVGIVDVPGHARFLHNMLAGVHGMDAVLLVVAADEGVMPQTREHLDIIQLLGAARVVVALSKVDLVEPGMVELARADVGAELGRRGIAARIIPVSAPTSFGLEELVTALGLMVAEAHPADRGRPRLPVDRAFTMAGFGTVVTGSLVDGVLRVGQELELVPAAGHGRRVRVRGLQQHNRKVDEARPGSRVAVNLQGIDQDQVRRGQVLAPPGTLAATTRFDARIRVLPGTAALRHNARVRVHSGTAEAAARVVLLDREELAPGTEGWAQLRLLVPLAVRDGDRLVMRRLSPAQILGGGEVVDSAAPPHRRAQSGVVIGGLSRRTEERGRVVEDLRRERPGTTAEAAARRLALDPAAAEILLRQLVASGDAVSIGGAFLDAHRWAEMVGRVRRELEAYHHRHPLRLGMPAGELRSPLGLDGKLAVEVLRALQGEGVVRALDRGLVALAGWEPRLTTAQRRAADEILARLGVTPLAPPRIGELGPDAAVLCRYLEAESRVVRIATDLCLLREAVQGAREALVRHLGVTSAVTVSEARDVLGSSRKVVVPLLEYFDAEHLTVRDGDVRRLRRTGPEAPGTVSAQ